MADDLKQYELFGATWYLVSRRFPTEALAKKAWQRLNDRGRREKGKLDLGIYRHGPMLVGQVFVTALGLRREGVELAASMLGGQPNELDPLVIQAMTTRRVRVLGELSRENAPSGSYAVRRGRRGAILHPDGTMDERINKG